MCASPASSHFSLSAFQRCSFLNVCIHQTTTTRHTLAAPIQVSGLRSQPSPQPLCQRTTLHANSDTAFAKLKALHSLYSLYSTFFSGAGAAFQEPKKRSLISKRLRILGSWEASKAFLSRIGAMNPRRSSAPYRPSAATVSPSPGGEVPSRGSAWG